MTKAETTEEKAKTPKKSEDYNEAIQKLIDEYPYIEGEGHLKRWERGLSDVSKKLLKKEKLSSKDYQFLAWKRSRRLANSEELFLLNAHEETQAPLLCENIKKIAAGHHVVIGQEYRCSKYYDDSRQCDVYKIYVGRVIPPEDRLPSAAERYLRNNHPIPHELIPTDEVRVVHCSLLRESEFNRYFKLV